MRTSTIGIALCALTLAVGASSPAQEPLSSDAPPARIVFACEHGSVKSLIAASFFNRKAQARGLSVRAVSRAAAPDTEVPLAVKEGLRADGFDLSGFVPTSLKASDVRGAMLVVSFDQDVRGIVSGHAPYEEWDDLPGVLSDYALGRNAIVQRVEELVNELSRRVPP